MTLQEIFDGLKSGKMTQTQAWEAFFKVGAAAGLDDARIAAGWTRFINASMNNQPLPTDALPTTTTGTGTQANNAGTQPTNQSSLIGNAALEGRTDPLTAYLARVGIGGKQNYNPAEAYQAGLFDPYMNLYQTQQRLTSPGGPLQNPSSQSATFSDFLNKVGTGIGGLEQGARGQLQNIFGSTDAQKATLGYEPGQTLPGSAGEASGQLDPGQLSELKQLFQYGLRPTAGTLGARYAASRLPQAQQAYYGQKAAGQLGGQANFLDWLKQNWGLQL